MTGLPNGSYSVIYADPPWRYQDTGCNGNAAGHYNTMSLNEICAMPVAEIASETRHSEKPTEIRHRIVELLGDVPRVELFARTKAPGWDAWGNEI